MADTASAENNEGNPSRCVLSNVTDTMVHIFSLLPFIERIRLTRVCRSWNALLLNDRGSCFKVLNLTGYSKLLDKGDRLASLLKRVGPQVRSLEMKMWLYDTMTMAELYERSERICRIISQYCEASQMEVMKMDRIVWISRWLKKFSRLKQVLIISSSYMEFSFKDHPFVKNFVWMHDHVQGKIFSKDRETNSKLVQRYVNLLNEISEAKYLRRFTAHFDEVGSKILLDTSFEISSITLLSLVVDVIDLKLDCPNLELLNTAKIIKDSSALKGAPSLKIYSGVPGHYPSQDLSDYMSRSEGHFVGNFVFANSNWKESLPKDSRPIRQLLIGHRRSEILSDFEFRARINGNLTCLIFDDGSTGTDTNGVWMYKLIGECNQLRSLWITANSRKDLMQSKDVVSTFTACSKSLRQIWIRGHLFTNKEATSTFFDLCQDIEIAQLRGDVDNSAAKLKKLQKAYLTTDDISILENFSEIAKSNVSLEIVAVWSFGFSQRQGNFHHQVTFVEIVPSWWRFFFKYHNKIIDSR